jgi:hypothetical protein
LKISLDSQKAEEKKRKAEATTAMALESLDTDAMETAADDIEQGREGVETKVLPALLRGLHVLSVFWFLPALQTVSLSKGKGSKSIKARDNRKMKDKFMKKKTKNTHFVRCSVLHNRVFLPLRVGLSREAQAAAVGQRAMMLFSCYEMECA